ncbi:MAG: tetratricopeptide repeat protein [Alphaproteobacteria bacterium]|nr:tetratricopeptide repeat protein [Alphaproteobacteria bacterium]
MRILYVIALCLLPATALATEGETPFRADSGLTKAEAQLSEGKYMQAMETLSGVVNRRPGDADALTYIGFAWLKMGDTDKAQKYIDRALKYDPKHLGANKYKADIFLMQGKTAQAHEQMQALRMVCGATDCAEIHALQGQMNRAVHSGAGDKNEQ